MNRLQIELRRLFAAEPASAAEPARSSPAGPPGLAALIGRSNDVRALVFEVVRPANWADLGKLWLGVQTAFELPPPAIAVSGIDGLQLWFSLVEPVQAERGHDFLVALAARFLPDVALRNLRFWPAREATASRQDLHARWVPAEQASTGNWSAYVAPDLAPVFSDTPWLDIPPGEDGQLSLVRGLQSVSPAAFEAAWLQLMPAPLRPSTSAASGAPGGHEAPLSMAVAARPSPMAGPTGMEAGQSGAEAAPRQRPPVFFAPPTAVPDNEPERFLRQVMNDDTAPLALRIEAAKALLPR